MGPVWRLPYAPGDRLWVRETWQVATGRHRGDLGAAVRYRSGWDVQSCWMPPEKAMPLGLTWDRWRPSIHMPRWASRITLEITDVRVERVQEISESDARAEGVEPVRFSAGLFWENYSTPETTTRSARESFESLWSATYGSESWDANPWTWVVEFRRVEVTQ